MKNIKEKIIAFENDRFENGGYGSVFKREIVELPEFYRAEGDEDNQFQSETEKFENFIGIKAFIKSNLIRDFNYNDNVDEGNFKIGNQELHICFTDKYIQFCIK